MSRGAVSLIIWLSSTAAALAGSEPFYSQSQALRHAYATHMIAARLEAAAAVAERGELDLVEQELDEAASRELPLLIGSLGQREGALAVAIETALQKAITSANVADPNTVEASTAGAIHLVGRAHGMLVPEPIQRDLTFTSAVMTMLLLSDDGVAERYEEAHEGDRFGYPTSWATLQRIQALWSASSEDIADREARHTVDEALEALHELIPSPLPPQVFTGDPEDAEEPSHRIVGALERLTGADLHPDRDLGRLVEFTRELAEAGCESYATDPALGLENVAWSHMHFAYFAKPLSLFGPGVMARLGGAYGRFGETAAVAPESACAELLEALHEARDVFGR